MTGAGRLSLGPQPVTEIPSGLSLSALDKPTATRRRGENTAPKIERQRFHYACRRPTSAEGLNQLGPHLKSPPDSSDRPML